ncbi:hypothetical protein ACIHCQ_00005 [Streptomyces sp. NPDC052236]|uniref:hypothetical protein n=1 Tax=Streptomyces sp. NPDC052236 TaxID=3365686 RepID=UPI0037CE59D4
MAARRAGPTGGGAMQLGDGEPDFLTRMQALGVFRAQRFSGEPSDRYLARRAGVSQTSVGVWLRGGRFPQDIRAVLVLVHELRQAARSLGAASLDVEACLDEELWRHAHAAEAKRRAGVVRAGVVQAQGQAVLRAIGPANEAVAPAPASRARRVKEWNPRLLGIKPSIEALGAVGDLPHYILRDHDRELRFALSRMATTGGMLLLVGNPSTGKSRSAYEGVLAELPGWWLLRPKDAVEVEDIAGSGVSRLVLWLDDLNRFLDARAPLSTSALVRMLDPRTPTVVVGVLWPDQYDRHAGLVAADYSSDTALSDARDILNLAETVLVADEFSASEKERAEEIAKRDPRIAAANEVSDFGLVQTLAGAPVLERRWRSGDVYGRALVEAAIDARRLGGPDAATHEFLRAAAPGYLTSTQWARADGHWWETALRYATEIVDGTTAALSPCAGSEPSSVVGYTVPRH